jgi:cysteine dioxygenase
MGRRNVGATMADTLSNLFRFLDRLQQRAPLAQLTAQMEALNIEVEDLAEYMRYSERGYRRNLVRAGDWYNLLVLCWRNGQRSPIHDHKGSSCAVRVLEGTMTETLFDFAPNGHVKARFSRDVLPGSVVGSKDTDMHQISNLQAGSVDLVTLHLYSPPLLIMGTYSMMDKSRGEEPMLMEFSEAGGI